MSRVHFARPASLASLRREYEKKVERNSVELVRLHFQNEQIYAKELPWVGRHLLQVENGRRPPWNPHSKRPEEVARRHWREMTESRIGRSWKPR
jgi:hypothetical protein